jgi:hypothetical protein
VTEATRARLTREVREQQERTHNVKRHLLALERWAQGPEPRAPFVPPEPPLDDPNAEPPPRYTFLTHLPLSLGRAQQAAAIRERINAGWASGAFLYEDPGTVLAWSAGWQAIADEFADDGCDLVVSPKNVDPDRLDDWCARWPEAIRERMVLAYWQEPEDDFATADKRATFRTRVAECAAVVRPHGIRNGVHLQSYALSAYPDYPHGPDVVADFIDATAVDHVGWSMFEFNGHDSGVTQTLRVASFMERFPEIPWSFDAVGFSVPIGAGEDARNNRAVNVAHAYDAIMATGAQGLAWYDVLSQDKKRDYLVDVPLAPVLATAAGALKGRV